jgi:hypothetical protein
VPSTLNLRAAEATRYGNSAVGRGPDTRRFNLDSALDAVHETYGQFTATKLESMTHAEPPWQKTRPNSVIAPELLVKYFTTLVQAGQKNQVIDGRPIWPTNSFRFQRRKELADRLAVRRQALRARASQISILDD